MSTLGAGPFDGINTLGDIARIHGRERPDAMALKFEGRMATYGMLEAHTNRVAHGLQVAGISKDDRIGYLAKNTDCFFELLIGGAKMGAVTLPIGWRLAAAEIAYLLENGDVSLLFVGKEFGDLARQAIEIADRSVRVIELESDEPGGYRAWRDSQHQGDPGIAISPSDTALQLYTSGTTGRPKGVMLTHSNLLEMWIRAGQAGIDCYNWAEDDVCLVAMPLAHIGGTGWGVVGLLNGAGLVILREFDPPTVLSLIEPERITKLFMVPAALNFMIQMPGARDVDYSRLKLIFYGASPIPLDLLRQCMDVFGCGFCQQYGMTEACGTIIYLPPEDHDPNGNRRMKSAGRAMPGIEIKIIDTLGNTLPPETVGEVATRSTSNMAGYWKNEAATRETIDAEGWLRTGDAGYLDADGYLYIHDRVKDMIISGAENIYPAEVESAIYGHPAVADVAIIGVPDERWGEAVKAMVVLKPGAEASEADIVRFARERIAAFKVPKSVDFVDVLPRNASGKVLKRTLREPYWAGRDRNVN
jgi:long-chain acyl-CoA synthetase